MSEEQYPAILLGEPLPSAGPGDLLILEVVKNFLFPLLANKFWAITIPTEIEGQVALWINTEAQIPSPGVQKSGEEITINFPPEKILHLTAVQIFFSEVHGEYPTPEIHINEEVDLDRIKGGGIEHFTAFWREEQKGLGMTAAMRHNWFAGKWRFPPHSDKAEAEAVPSFPARMSSSFLNALQRGPKQLTLWGQEEESKALALRQEGRKAAEEGALQLAHTFRGAVDKHHTRPDFSLREWEALWGLHALLRRAGYPQRLIFTRAEYYAAAGAETSFHRGRKDVLGSDRQQLDEAIQALFEKEQVFYWEGKDAKGNPRRAELHIHILTDWGKAEEGENDAGEARYFATFHEVALHQIRDHFVNLPPLREVKAALERAGATGRGGGMVTDLELVLWLHADPYNHHEGGCHVDWLNLAEKLGLGAMLAQGHKKKARERLILAYERAVKAGYLLSYELDRRGGLGLVDRLVKNTALLTGKLLLDPPQEEGV